MKKQTNENKQHKQLMQLAILGLFTIAGLVSMLQISADIDAQVTLKELNRLQTPMYTNYNPCAEVKCTPFGPAVWVGEDRTALVETDRYGGNKICQCPDGKTVIARPYVPKRFLQ